MSIEKSKKIIKKKYLIKALMNLGLFIMGLIILCFCIVYMQKYPYTIISEILFFFTMGLFLFNWYFLCLFVSYSYYHDKLVPNSYVNMKRQYRKALEKSGLSYKTLVD